MVSQCHLLVLLLFLPFLLFVVVVVIAVIAATVTATISCCPVAVGCAQRVLRRCTRCCARLRRGRHSEL